MNAVLFSAVHCGKNALVTAPVILSPCKPQVHNNADKNCCNVKTNILSAFPNTGNNICPTISGIFNPANVLIPQHTNVMKK